jgi:hypothetical protein
LFLQTTAARSPLCQLNASAAASTESDHHRFAATLPSGNDWASGENPANAYSYDRWLDSEPFEERAVIAIFGKDFIFGITPD